jgi:hypothetical protein
MIERVYTILVGFNTLQNGIDYMFSSPYKIAFSVDGQTYSYLGQPIDTPVDSEIIMVGNVFITNTEDPAPGDVYIDNGFLKYYKEITNE